uniref:Anaphase-promoting complex subunit 4-like WD40 domain-containing protein n=1 Tax=Arcella intermedia TaxID=1963864 RepID=A0A6B2LC20_9EUKA
MEMKGHTGSISVLCWNPAHSEQLVTTSLDQSIRLWDVRTGKNTANLPAKGEGINIAWSPDGNTIICGSKGSPTVDQLLQIDVRKNKTVKIVKFHYLVNEMAWHKDGNKLYLTTGSGDIEIRNWPEFKMIRSIPAHTAAIFSIDINPNGKNFAVGSADSLVSLWDANELVCLRTFTNLNSMVRTISISHDGQFIASGSEDTYIDISHVETGEKIATLKCDAATNELAWHPKKLLLAFAGDEKDGHGHDKGSVKIFGFDR